MPRGKKYNKKQMLELYKQGMSYEEIAERINSNSVQSVRHSIERWNREEKSRIREEEERKRLRKEKELQEEQIKRKRIEDEKKAPKKGMLDYLIDNETWEALKYIIPVEYKDKVLFDDENSTFYISEDLDFSDFSLYLFTYGFYLELKKNVDSNEYPMEIRIMHSSPSSKIDDVKQLIPLFRFNYDMDKQEEVKLSLKDLIIEGRVEFEDFHVNVKDGSVTPDAIRNRIKSTGYRTRIFYNPLATLDYLNFRIIGAEDGKLRLVYNYTDEELENLIINIMKADKEAILIVSNAVLSIKQGNFTINQKDDHFYGLLREHLLNALKPIEVNVYPPYFLKLAKDSSVLKSIASFEEKLKESVLLAVTNYY